MNVLQRIARLCQIDPFAPDEEHVPYRAYGDAESPTPMPLKALALYSHKVLCSCGDGSAIILDTDNGEVRRENGVSVRRMRPLQDGFVCISCTDYSLAIYDMIVQCAHDRQKEKICAKFTGHENTVTDFRVRNGRLYSVSMDQVALEYRLPPLSELVDAGDMVAERKFDGHEGPIACLCVTDTSVYTGSSDHTMRRYSLASGECVDVYRGHRGWVITVNEFEGMVITSSKDETIRCWEAERKPDHVNTNHCLEEIPCPGGLMAHIVRIRDVVGSGSAVLYAAMDSSVISFKLSNISRVDHVFEGHRGKIRALELHEYSRTMFTSASDGTIRRWCIGLNPRCLAVYKAHKRSHVNAIKLDSAWMFSSSDDGTVKQWSIADQPMASRLLTPASTEETQSLSDEAHKFERFWERGIETGIFSRDIVPTIKGDLMFRSKKQSSWKQAFVAVVHPALYITSVDDDLDEGPSVCFLLDGCVLGAQKRNRRMFHVFHPSQGSFSFRARTRKEMMRWLTALARDLNQMEVLDALASGPAVAEPDAKKSLVNLRNRVVPDFFGGTSLRKEAVRMSSDESATSDGEDTNLRCPSPLARADMKQIAHPPPADPAPPRPQVQKMRDRIVSDNFSSVSVSSDTGRLAGLDRKRAETTQLSVSSDAVTRSTSFSFDMDRPAFVWGQQRERSSSIASCKLLSGHRMSHPVESPQQKDRPVLRSTPPRLLGSQKSSSMPDITRPLRPPRSAKGIAPPSGGQPKLMRTPKSRRLSVFLEKGGRRVMKGDKQPPTLKAVAKDRDLDVQETRLRQSMQRMSRIFVEHEVREAFARARSEWSSTQDSRTFSVGSDSATKTHMQMDISEEEDDELVAEEGSEEVMDRKMARVSQRLSRLAPLKERSGGGDDLDEDAAFDLHATNPDTVELMHDILHYAIGAEDGEEEDDEEEDDKSS